MASYALRDKLYQDRASSDDGKFFESAKNKTPAFSQASRDVHTSV